MFLPRNFICVAIVFPLDFLCSPFARWRHGDIAIRIGSPASARGRPGPTEESPYRITLVGVEWHVRRPHASLSHAFAGLDQAETSVRKDSAGTATFVEILADGIYMVKDLRSGR